MASELTPKQQRFVEEYLIDFNGKQAAIRVGYSEKTAEVQASRLLSNAKVSAAVDAGRAKAAERAEISQDWILKNLKTVTERCMQVTAVLDRKGQPVFVENADGEAVPAYVFNAMGANRSLELLGKHIGMFGDSLKLSGGVDLNAKVTIYMPDNGRDSD